MKSKRTIEYILPYMGWILLLVIWETVSVSGFVNSYVLPSPEKVWSTFLKMVRTGELYKDIAISFRRVMKAYIIAFGLAFSLGAIRYAFPRYSLCFEKTIQFMRNVPPIAMIPLLILWCGIGELTKSVIILLASFFPIYLSIVKGFCSVDPNLLEVGVAFGYSKSRSFFHITLPAAVPDILVGCRTGMGYAWRAIIGAEMIAASGGIGYRILFSQQMSRTDKVIVGIFAIGLIGSITDFLMGLILKASLKGVSKHGWD